MDHTSLPPPPYSETDALSRSGPESSQAAILTPATSQADAASATNRPISVYTASSSSEADGALLTPPYSPSGNGSFHQSPSSRSAEESGHISSSAAELYFESRPAPRVSNTLLIHTIKIADYSQPSDLPYPEPQDKWMERDVLSQDWQTFVNYLIPHHADVHNNDLADRKLKDELIDERMSRLTLDQDVIRMTNMDHVEAQLAPLRKIQDNNCATSDAETVVHEWNEGFFGPRGLKIEITHLQNDEGLARPMPGSWTNDMDEPNDVTGNSCSRESGWKWDGRRGGRGGFGRMGRGFGGGWMRAGNEGFHLGRGILSADNNGFRMFGNGLVADKSGFRMGNFLAADERGLRLGRHSFGSHPEHGHEHSREAEPAERGRYRNHSHDGHGRHRHHRRSRSSSSSSSSSLSSVESVGSLPDYDKLNDAQLPVAKQSIQNWLEHPDQPITREIVKNIIHEIKSAKKMSVSKKDGDLKDLRTELKGMMRSFKGIVKAQKQVKREEKRKRRAERRQQKRERKAIRRQYRRERQEQRREVRQDRRGNEAESEEPSALHMSSGAGPMHPLSDWPVGRRVPIPGAFPPPVMSPLPPATTVQNINSMGPGNPGFPSHPMFSMAGITQGRGWPYMNNMQPGYDMSAAARLEAEGRRIEAEERGREARLRAEKIQRHTQAKVTKLRYKAEVIAALNKQKADATRIRTESQRMKNEVLRIRSQAATYQQSETARTELLAVADRLEEEAEKTKRESDRLWAEAVQFGEEVKTELTQKDTYAQESGVIHE